MFNYVISFLIMDILLRILDTLSQPRFRILRILAFPDFEMKLGLSIDGIDISQKLPGLDLVASLHGDIPHLAVKREIVSMLDQHALIISRHREHLRNDTVKHGLHMVTLGQSYVHTIVGGSSRFL